MQAKPFERYLILRKFATILLLLTGSSILMAQSAPSAFEVKYDLRVGAELSDFNPDYFCSTNMPFACGNDLLGLGITADYQLGAKFSAEGEARWLPWNGASGETQSSYLIGAGYRLWSRNALALSGKFLAGIGRISVPGLRAAMFAYAPGTDLSVRLPCFSSAIRQSFITVPAIIGGNLSCCICSFNRYGAARTLPSVRLPRSI